jgi:hypothetical protein
MEPALPLAALAISALQLAAVVIPAPEHRIVLITQAEAITPTITPSYSGAGEESATPTALSSIKVQEICTYIFTTQYGLWWSVSSLVIIG